MDRVRLGRLVVIRPRDDRLIGRVQARADDAEAEETATNANSPNKARLGANAPQRRRSFALDLVRVSGYAFPCPWSARRRLVNELVDRPLHPGDRLDARLFSLFPLSAGQRDERTATDCGRK